MRDAPGLATSPGASSRPPGGRLGAELDALRDGRPRLHAVLVALGRRPEAVLAPVAAVVSGLVAAQIAGGDAGWFQRAGAGMWGDVGLDVFGEPGLQIGPLYLAVVGGLSAVLPGASGPGAARGLIGALQAVALVLLTGLVAARAARFHGARDLPVRWAAGLVLVLGGFVASAAVNGHFEEIALGLLLALAALAGTQGRPVTAGALVGVAVALKQWAVLGVPVFLVGRRPRVLVVACLVAGATAVAAYAPFVLLGEFRTLEFTWGFRDGSVLGVLESWFGLSEWALRAVQAGAAVGAGAVVAWWSSRSPLAPVVVVVAVRLLLDPLRLPYYSGPLVVVLVVWLWSSRAALALRVRLLVAACAPLVVLGQAAFPFPVVRHGGTVVLVAVLALAVALVRAEARTRTVSTP